MKKKIESSAKYPERSKLRVLLRAAELLISFNLANSSLCIRIFTVHVRGCGSWEQPGSVVQVKRVFQHPAALTQLMRRNWSPGRDLCSLQSTGVHRQNGPWCTPDPPLWFSHRLKGWSCFHSHPGMLLQGLATALICGSVIPCLPKRAPDRSDEEFGGFVHCVVFCPNFLVCLWCADGCCCHVVPETTDSRTGSSLEAASGHASGKQ